MIVTFLLRRTLPLLAVSALMLLCGKTFGASLLHRYSFTSDAADSVGTSHGTLMNGAVLSGGAVVLNGSGAYVDLPNGLLTGLNDITIELWLTDNASGAWARIFDFGNSSGGEDNPASGAQYMFLSPQGGTGTLRGAITITGGGAGEQLLQWTGTRLPVGIQEHVVWTSDSATTTGTLYVDGVAVATNFSMSLRPADLEPTLNNWLGRSQFSADPSLNASISEFRIYNGALTATQVQQNFTFGPEVATSDGPVTISTQPQSQTVGELSPVTFEVKYDGTRPVKVQWYRGSSIIPGATNDSYTIPSVTMAEQNVTFRAALTNTFNGTPFSAISGNAILSVSPDLVKPLLLSAASLYPTGVVVQFSEGLRADSIANLGNYSISHSGGTLAVSAANFGANSSNLVLTTAAQALSTVYALTVSGVRDLAAAANLIQANSQAAFTASPYLTADIGAPAVSGSLTPVPGGYDGVAGGSGIGGASDQFSFNYRTYSGDFDVQIRVASLPLSAAWARAGLMARDGLTANAPFAASFATPGPAGCYFGYRIAPGSGSPMAGSFPVNFPDTWLRLRRVGNLFEGFASLDGQTWRPLGSANLLVSPSLQVGLALAAGTASGTTTVQFRNESAGSGPIAASIPLPFESLGPCSRRTPLVITEIMYNAPSSWGGTNSLEFVELWNSGLATEDLTGHRLTGDISYQFPNGTKIAPGQFLVVARDPAEAQAFYGTAFLGPYTNKLNNGNGTLRLVNELGGRLLDIQFDNRDDWPVAPDGTGHSLVLRRPSYGENDPRAWAASDVIGGSPGRGEHWGTEPARDVVLNEFLAHTDEPQQDYIELFNPGAQPVDLSGGWLSDEAGTNKFRIPNGTTIAARGFKSWNQTQLGFSLAADGEQIFLVNSNQTRVLDAISFRGQANGVTAGRYPDGAPGFQELATPTEGTANSAALLRPLVINEIMYHAISEANDDEYIEIFNRSNGPVNLSNWRIQGGISFTFPSNIIIAPQGYVVVAENRTNLLAKYPQLNATNTFGNFDGSLANSGERIALAMPEDLVSTNAQQVVITNIYYIPVDEVAYRDGGRWGQWSDAGGSSLELKDPDADNRLAGNWADSDESAKAAWTTIDITDVLENGQNAATVDEGSTTQGVANRFELFLQGPGEALLDNVEFRNNGGANLVANGNFESGAGGWTMTGVLRASFAQNSVGVGNSQALHLVSTDRGDTGPNKIATALSSTATVGAPNTGTMRASVRWLKGSPYVLLRLRGNWMEVSKRLNIPANCGTPGLPNSRLVPNAGPAIEDVSHAPVLPGTNEAVVVTARIKDVDAMGTATLRYRVDPTASYTTLAMNDLGTGGDAVAGDGVYSGTIPGQAGGALVAFSLQASDGLGASSLFPPEAPTREGHVRWGETIIPGSLGTYRLWLTSSNINFWTSRERNANDPIDATFVYGNSRVVYNANTMYSGSPFHTPNYNGPLAQIASDYEVNFPPDNRFLGSEPFVLTAYDVASGNFFFNDDSGQVDLTGNWIARKLGQPFNYRRHVHVVMNGVRRGTIYDDAQQPNSEVIEEFFPNDELRQLRKIESWFEFADNAQSQGSTYTTIERFNKSTGVIDTKRYRWNWRPRATDNPDDWYAFTNLIAAVNDTSAPDYESRVRAWMDVRNFLRPVAVHHICASWDSYAYDRGKNMFAYKPDNAPWRLLMWDIELSMNAGGNSTSDSIYRMFDPALLNMIQDTPAFNREYLMAIQEAVDGPLAAGAADAVLDERYANFQQNSVPLISPQGTKTWLAQRRNNLITQLQQYAPPVSFAVSGPASQSTGNSAITFSGTAPLTVQTILINGAVYPLRWTGVTSWTVNVALNGGNNTFVFQGLDRNGAVVTSVTNTVNFTGSVVLPEGNVVFNEIMAQPALPEAEYVELFNTHATYTFNLTGWRVNGLDYTFPPGASIGPRSYRVLARNAEACIAAYGGGVTIFAEYSGNLDKEGETLTLFRPGAGTNEVVVDRVRFEPTLPWARTTNGVSLQLVDTAQDNSRAANWATGSTNASPSASPQTLLDFDRVWRYLDAANLDGINWMAISYNDAGWAAGPGLLAFENNAAINGIIRTVLVDPRLSSPGLSAGHADYFRTAFNFTNSLVDATFTAEVYLDDGAVVYVNGSELPRIRMPSGTVTNQSLATGQPPGSDATTPQSLDVPASLIRAGNNVIAVSVHQVTTNSSDIVFGLRLRVDYPSSPVATQFTPGATNSVGAVLPAFPPVWLNELQADNVAGPQDNFGQRDPWVELHNAGASAFSLDGYYLSDTYGNLTKWPFPAGLSIPAGGYALVWCDNQPNQTAANAPHTNFRLTSGSGSVALSRLNNGSPQVVDYLNYTNLPSNQSYGDVPDGQPFFRSPMFFATAGSTNSGTSAPLTVFINEWMADNVSTLADPADGNYEDWFEIYNPGPNPADLGGYFLTDVLTNKFQFQIPNNGHYVIPPGGYLLVWADNEDNQNTTNRTDLHANFALSKGGEAIGLFAADGTLIDSVTFGAQVTDASQGRFPNGAAFVQTLPKPTPGAANLLSNLAPVLTAIGNKVVTLGQTLNFTVVATDADQPPQSLNYTLSGAPLGASLNPTTGQFIWTPNFAPATNTLGVIVTDSGAPSLSATQNFNVIVTFPPKLSVFKLAGNQLTFSWPTVPGQQFQLEYKDDLGDAVWLPVGNPMTGTGAPLSFTADHDAPHEYFRLRVLP